MVDVKREGMSDGRAGVYASVCFCVNACGVPGVSVIPLPLCVRAVVCDLIACSLAFGNKC